MKLSLNLLVLRTTNLEITISFYQKIGLSFTEEQHGKGPIHYSCQIDNILLEIYPGTSGNAPERKSAGATLIGFQVDNLDKIVEALSDLEGSILSFPQDSPWGRRMVIQDPDGRAIELNQSYISSGV